MVSLLSTLAVLVGIAGLLAYQWISFFPRLGIGYLYHIRWVRLGFAVVTLGLAGLAYWLQPDVGQGIVLGVALILALLSGFFRPDRALVALAHPRHRAATETSLGKEAPILGFTYNGESCAWPLAILVPHHLVNDDVGGEPVLAGW